MSVKRRRDIMAEAWPHLFRLITPLLVGLVLVFVQDMRATVRDLSALVPVVAAHGARIDSLEKVRR